MNKKEIRTCVVNTGHNEVTLQTGLLIFYLAPFHLHFYITLSFKENHTKVTAC